MGSNPLPNSRPLTLNIRAGTWWNKACPAWRNLLFVKLLSGPPPRQYLLDIPYWLVMRPKELILVSIRSPPTGQLSDHSQNVQSCKLYARDVQSSAWGGVLGIPYRLVNSNETKIVHIIGGQAPFYKPMLFGWVRVITHILRVFMIKCTVDYFVF